MILGADTRREGCHDRVTYRVCDRDSGRALASRDLHDIDHHGRLVVPLLSFSNVVKDTDKYGSPARKHGYNLFAGWRVSERCSCTGLILNLCHRYIYTGGSDSLVRVWKTELGTDQEPDAALDAMESITCLSTGVCELPSYASSTYDVCCYREVIGFRGVRMRK